MLDGQDITLTEAQIEEAENAFSFANALDKMFRRFWKECANADKKERSIWQKMEKLAKEQFPDFDTEKYYLKYSWERKKVSIIQKVEKKDEFGID